MAFDPLPQYVQVHPTTKSGSTVATLKLWIDEAVLNLSTSLRIFKVAGIISHNFSDQIVPHFTSHIQPLFKISPSEDPSIANISYLNFDAATLSRLMASSMEWCAVTSSTKRYVAISLDLRLLDDSLYHLGEHNVIIGADLYTPNNHYAFDTVLGLTVEAG